MDNRNRIEPLNVVRGTPNTQAQLQQRSTTSTPLTLQQQQQQQQVKPQSGGDYDWRKNLTPNRLKMFHTIIVIMFIVLIMTYIFNFKSNIIRVLLIIAISLVLFCESFIIYSYSWQ